jgi:hypothetical protein
MERAIRIPLCNSQQTVVVFPDEIDDSLDGEEFPLLDVLRGEFSPLSIWKQCAVEFHRQSMDSKFHRILNEIVEALETYESK